MINLLSFGETLSYVVRVSGFSCHIRCVKLDCSLFDWKQRSQFGHTHSEPIDLNGVLLGQGKCNPLRMIFIGTRLRVPAEIADKSAVGTEYKSEGATN